MSPRPARTEVRTALLEAAARVLAEHGPSALSTRRLAQEIGASTTAVYTYFGAMPELVRAVVHEGFARLGDRLARTPSTDDPLLDKTRLLYTYRDFALAEPHLYRVMFGGSATAGFELTPDDRAIGSQVFQVSLDGVRRLIAAGRYTDEDPWPVALGIWSALHGHVMLETNGYFLREGSAEASFDRLVRTLHVGAGCPADAAAEAVDGIRAERSPSAGG